MAAAPACTALQKGGHLQNFCISPLWLNIYPALLSWARGQEQLENFIPEKSSTTFPKSTKCINSHLEQGKVFCVCFYHEDLHIQVVKGFFWG